MTDWPRVDAQLQSGSPTKGADCSIQCIRGGVRWATRGQTVPTVTEIRQLINVPTSGITMSQALTGYQGFGVTAKKATSWTDVELALQAGKAVHVAIGYAWVNDNAKYLSGQATFRGKHGIVVFGLEQVVKDGTNWVGWLDPLHDGRRAGVAKQITMARLKDVKGAMDAFGSIGAVIITQNPVPEPPPPSTPTDPTSGQRRAALDAIKTLAEEAP